MARRRRHGGEGHENTERWLLTYADMITLLMAFFIMMYSMSVLNLQKFNEVAFSIRSGFGGMLPGKGVHFLKAPDRKHINRTGGMGTEREAMMHISLRMNAAIAAKNLQNKVEVHWEERGLVMSMATDNLLFPRGSAELTPIAEVLLTEIALVLKSFPNDILVEGHTCSLPIHSQAFPSNWELSSARASRVVRLLQEKGISSRQLCAIGYADSRPRADNNTETSRERNRRVEIVLLNSNFSAEHEYNRRQVEGRYRPNIPRIPIVIPKVWNGAQ